VIQAITQMSGIPTG